MGVEAMSAVQMAEFILKEYRTLDCACCNKFFGYMHRQTGAIYCSSNCLTSSGSTCTPGQSFGHTFIPASPLTPHQILAVTSHVGDQPKVNLFSKKKEEDVPDGARSIETKASSKNHGDEPTVNPFSKKNENVQSKEKRAPSPKKDYEEPRLAKRVEEPNVSRNKGDEEEPSVNPFMKKKEKTQPEKRPASPKKDRDEPRVTKKAEEVRVSRNKEDAPTVNPFLKAVPKKESDEPRKTTEARVCRNKDTTEEQTVNPFMKKNAQPKEKTPSPVVLSPPPEKEPERVVKLVKVVANPTVVKLRSALSWSPDPDDMIGQLMLGGKCNDNGPTDFYFQSAAMAKKLISLQSDIANFCSTAVSVPLESLELGQLVFAPYSDELFRGEIINIPKPDTADVFFVDYGNTLEIPKKLLSVLPKEFTSIPRLCFQCYWDLWLTRDPKEDVTESITERYHSTETKGVTILQKLDEGMYLIAIGPKVENAVFILEKYFKFDKVPVVAKSKPKTPREERPTPPFTPAKPAAKPATPRKKYMFNDCKYSAELVDGALVKIGFVWNYTKYLVSCGKDEDKIIQLQVELNEGMAQSKKLKTMPEVNEVVLAPYQGEFYRAKVISQEDKESVKVMFFDFGDMGSVKYTELYEPSEKIMKHPLYAMNVVLHGVPEIKGNVSLDDECNSLLAIPLQLQINSEPTEDSNVHAVTLWNDNNTLNKVIKRAALKAQEQGQAGKSYPPPKKSYSYIQSLAFNSDYGVATLAAYEQKERALMEEMEHGVPYSYNWSAYDTKFDYFYEELGFLALKGFLDVRVVRYRKLDSIVVLPLGAAYDNYREFLCDDVENYVCRALWDEYFEPKPKQICLVKLPNWKEYSETLIKIYGSKEFAKISNNKPMLEKVDNQFTGRWHRAIFKCKVSFPNEYYYFDFIDLGRTAYVTKPNLYKSPTIFLVAPIFTSTLVILWLEMDQMSKEMDMAMEMVMTKGLDIKIQVVAEQDDLVMVRLIEPDEKQLIEKALLRLKHLEADTIKIKNQPRRPGKANESTLPRSMRVKSYDPPGLVPTQLIVDLDSSDDDLEMLLVDDINLQYR